MKTETADKMRARERTSSKGGLARRYRAPGARARGGAGCLPRMECIRGKNEEEGRSERSWLRNKVEFSASWIINDIMQTRRHGVKRSAYSLMLRELIWWKTSERPGQARARGSRRAKERERKRERKNGKRREKERERKEETGKRRISRRKIAFRKARALFSSHYPVGSRKTFPFSSSLYSSFPITRVYTTSRLTSHLKPTNRLAFIATIAMLFLTARENNLHFHTYICIH